ATSWEWAAQAGDSALFFFPLVFVTFLICTVMILAERRYSTKWFHSGYVEVPSLRIASAGHNKTVFGSMDILRIKYVSVFRGSEHIQLGNNKKRGDEKAPPTISCLF